jgi:hypothetical protein
MEFSDESALYNKLLSVLRYLTGISGKRWDQYWTYGQELIRDAINKEKNKNKNDNGSIKSNDSTAAAATIASDYYEGYTDKMKNSPYAKLKGAPIDEFVANTRAYRKLLIEKDKTSVGDREIYYLQAVLHDLLPILKDFSGMLDKEAEARSEKHKLSGA